MPGSCRREAILDGELLTPDAARLADTLAGWVRDQVEMLVTRYCTDWRVPRVFAGYPVGPDVRADLAYTLGLLAAAGEDAVAGQPIPQAIASVLRDIDGPATHTFFSYRVAETLARYGRFADNALIDGWSAAERANLAEACDSTAWIALLDQGQLPANYAAVLARCELARSALGLPVDEQTLTRLVERVASLFTRHPSGWHDDSPAGAGRYDIYAADLYLFAEPLAAASQFAAPLAAPWQRGLRAVLDLVVKIGARNGAAFPWGRSTGALAVCLTVELGALAAARGLGHDTRVWLGRAAHAFEQFKGWMHDGLITAHRNRSPYSYRGLQRWLQMTLDALGKVAWAAVQLRHAPATLDAAPAASLFPPHDELVVFSTQPWAGVWTYRSRALRFVLPLVGSTLNDYLPGPQAPGFLEVPTEVDLPTGVPLLARGGTRFTSGGAPVAVAHDDGRLRLTWDRFPRAGAWDCTTETPALSGTRTLELEVCGGQLRAHDRLRFTELPDAVALQFAESGARALRVTFECGTPHRASTIETAGIKEYRSFWGELQRVHQIDIEPAAAIDLRWTVAPVLRVATSASAHAYNRCLYDPLAGRVAETQFPYEWMAEPDAAEADGFLQSLDVFHLHWPEWLSHSLDVHQSLIARLRAAEVRIVWTQHNLVPHYRDVALGDIYQLWAEAADAAIHHSRHGEQRSLARYRFRSECIHRVIPHPHFGHLMARSAGAERTEVERELGLRPCTIRLGIVGAPRPEKDVQLVLEAFAACHRADLGLLVASLGPDDRVPDDPRITALPYEMVDRATYDRRLRGIDVLVFPIRPGELLTSGVVGDAVGAGLPALVSDWAFLTEALGEAAICYGATAADLTGCLERLTSDELARAAAGSRALQPLYARERVAELTLDLLTEVGSAKL
jgi:glycosyltransferase involved in cell wall biosynthesis